MLLFVFVLATLASASPVDTTPNASASNSKSLKQKVQVDSPPSESPLNSLASLDESLEDSVPVNPTTTTSNIGHLPPFSWRVTEQVPLSQALAPNDPSSIPLPNLGFLKARTRFPIKAQEQPVSLEALDTEIRSLLETFKTVPSTPEEILEALNVPISATKVPSGMAKLMKQLGISMTLVLSAPGPQYDALVNSVTYQLWKSGQKAGKYISEKAGPESRIYSSQEVPCGLSPQSYDVVKPLEALRDRNVDGLPWNRKRELAISMLGLNPKSAAFTEEQVIDAFIQVTAVLRRDAARASGYPRRIVRAIKVLRKAVVWARL